MISAIQSFSSTAYSSAVLQARYQSVASRQSIQSHESARALRSSTAGVAEAAELSGAALTQQIFGKAFAATISDTASVADQSRIGQQPRRLQTQAPLAETPDGVDAARDVAFSGLLQGRLAPQSLADVQSRPTLALDSSSFLALFAQAAAPTTQKAASVIQAQPFARASSALEQIFAGADLPAVDFAA